MSKAVKVIDRAGVSRVHVPADVVDELTLRMNLGAASSARGSGTAVGLMRPSEPFPLLSPREARRVLQVVRYGQRDVYGGARSGGEITAWLVGFLAGTLGIEDGVFTVGDARSVLEVATARANITKALRCPGSGLLSDARPGSTLTCSHCGRHGKTTKARRMPVHQVQR